MPYIDEVAIITNRLEAINKRSRLVGMRITTLAVQVRSLQQEVRTVDKHEAEAIRSGNENLQQRCLMEREALMDEIVLLECWIAGLRSDQKTSEHAYDTLTEQLEKLSP